MGESDYLQSFCSRKPTHWKCVGTDRRCMISFVECRIPQTTTVMPTTTTALAIDDVFRDDTVVVGVTDSPVTLSSTTPYALLNPGAVANPDVWDIGPAKIAVNGWIVLVGCLGVALITTTLSWKIAKRWCDTCETRALRPPNTVARITGEDDDDDRRRRNQRRRARSNGGADRAKFDNDLIMNVPVESLNRLVRLQQHQLPGIETNRHLPQLANFQTVQYSTTVLSNSRENRNTRVPRLNHGPELPTFQQAILETIEENSSRPSSAGSGTVVANSSAQVIANSTPPSQAPDPMIAHERSLQRETTPGFTLQTQEIAEEIELPDLEEVRGNASAPPPTYSLSDERGILSNGQETAAVNACYENGTHGPTATDTQGNLQ